MLENQVHWHRTINSLGSSTEGIGDYSQSFFYTSKWTVPKTSMPL